MRGHENQTEGIPVFYGNHEVRVCCLGGIIVLSLILLTLFRVDPLASILEPLPCLFMSSLSVVSIDLSVAA